MISGMAATRTATTIRRARLRKRWTQKRLAEAAGVSLRTVNDWENDRAYPRNPVAVEEILGVSLDTGEPQPVREIPPDMRKWIAEALPDDPDGQRRVIGLLEGTLTWPGKGRDETPRRAAG
jgi:transcriptional regulator with XRE-family HTH domain